MEIQTILSGKVLMLKDILLRLTAEETLYSKTVNLSVRKVPVDLSTIIQLNLNHLISKNNHMDGYVIGNQIFFDNNIFGRRMSPDFL